MGGKGIKVAWVPVVKKKKEVENEQQLFMGESASLFLDDEHQKQAADVFNVWKKWV